jgi:hypothetical protein
MAYIRGEAQEQTTMFPVTLDELIPADHMCRVIEAFGDRLEVAGLGLGGTGRNRAAWLRSARSSEAVSVRVWAAGTVVAATGSRVHAQWGSDGVARTIAADLRTRE